MNIKNLLNLIYLLISILILAFNSACSSTTDQVINQQVAKQMSFKKGEYISFIAPKTVQVNKELLNEYYSRAFPIAEGYGLKRQFQFNVSEKVIGDFLPDGLIVYSWPNKQAEEKLFAHPDWSEIKALRPKIWDDLRIYSSELKEDIRFNFKSDKYYTLAVAWLKAETSSDYTKYLNGIESDLNALGGRFMYRMKDPVFESHNTPQGAPSQLTFVEWDTKDALVKLQKSKGYKNNVQYFQNSVVGFELHYITPVLN